MFDSINIRPGGGTHYHSHNTHEHRAPTDESVRLLMEMQAKAKESLMSVSELPPNILSCRWWVWENPAEWKREIRVKFVLNGTEHSLEIDMPETELKRDPDPRAMLLKVRDALALRLAGIMTEDLIQSSERRNLIR